MASPEKEAGMLRNLKAKTGRDLSEWLAHIAAEGPAERKELVAWLKEQGVGHFQVRLILKHRP
jgi:hypothetical protein